MRANTSARSQKHAKGSATRAPQLPTASGAAGTATGISPGPGVGGRGDGRGGVAANVTADARLGLGLGVDVGREVGGEGARPVGGAGGVDVDRDVELLEGADVLCGKYEVRGICPRMNLARPHLEEAAGAAQHHRPPARPPALARSPCCGRAAAVHFSTPEALALPAASHPADTPHFPRWRRRARKAGTRGSGPRGQPRPAPPRGAPRERRQGGRGKAGSCRPQRATLRASAPRCRATAASMAPRARPPALRPPALCTLVVGAPRGDTKPWRTWNIAKCGVSTPKPGLMFSRVPEICARARPFFALGVFWGHAGGALSPSLRIQVQK